MWRWVVRFTLLLVSGQVHTATGEWSGSHCYWWVVRFTLLLVSGQVHTATGEWSGSHSYWWVVRFTLLLVSGQVHTPTGEWSGSHSYWCNRRGNPSFSTLPPHAFRYHLERMLPGRCGEKFSASTEYRNPILWSAHSAYLQYRLNNFCSKWGNNVGCELRAMNPLPIVQATFNTGAFDFSTNFQGNWSNSAVIYVTLASKPATSLLCF